MSNQIASSSAKELFRYATIKSSQVVDLKNRLEQIKEGREWLEKTNRQKYSEARKFLKSDKYAKSIENLTYNYFEILTIDKIPETTLSNYSIVENIEAFKSSRPRKSNNYKSDLKNVSLSLYASIILGDSEEIDRLSKTLQFIELFPNLLAAKSEKPYAPIVTKRFVNQGKNANKSEIKSPSKEEKNNKNNERQLSSKQVLLLWDVLNKYKDFKRLSIDNEIESLRKKRFKLDKTKINRKTRGRIPTKVLKQAHSIQFKEFLSQKKLTLKSLRHDNINIKQANETELLAKALDYDRFIENLTGIHKDLITKHKPEIKTVLSRGGNSHIISLGQWYKLIKERENNISSSMEDCSIPITDPCLLKLSNDAHVLDTTDNVKPLGEAELIVVEENWIKYTPGEISNIETVLQNEKRLKETTSEKIFENISEIATQEVEEKESETESTTTNELSSQIENVIDTQFNSDINSSASGSGGGTIGVIDFHGEASIGADVGIGMDTSMSTASESNFSNEIISKAIEKTKKTTSERRTNRTFRRYETKYTYEIDNIGSNSSHINGVYCYLDKHICITERIYGVRQFLIADVIYPGMDLIKIETARRSIDLNDVGLPPVFDITPNDITEANYLSHVGRYRASNVNPPPPVVKMVSRTYKTDQTNENKEQEENTIKKVADVLVPFFGEYKRFLIQDNIDIPEGYQVQEVKVTVTHGKNGVSIPAHLPFSLGGALIYSMPKLAIAQIPIYTLFYLPIALAEIIYLASPVLHYNADSSNVTINIGHETAESPYYFFPPERLLEIIQDFINPDSLLSDDSLEDLLSDITDGLIDEIREVGQTMIDTISSNVLTYGGDLLESIKNIFQSLQDLLNPTIVDPTVKLDAFNNFLGALKILGNAALALNIDLSELFAPLIVIFERLINLIKSRFGQILDTLEQFFLEEFNNVDTWNSSKTSSFTGKLPVSFNCIGLKPGITINLTASMVRVDDQTLDAWKMETFDRLNQAYFQLEAEYESKLLMSNDKPILRSSPGLMREEEKTVIKDRVFGALNNLFSSTNSNSSSTNSVTNISLERRKLFEHSIDWQNFSYRLYNYGPNGLQVYNEKLGLYKTADERRKVFMDALWAQVLIPLKENEMLESMMLGYIKSGEIKTLDDLIDENTDPDNQIDEIAAIYRDIILRRNQLLENPIETHRADVIPTDLVVILDELPENDTRC